MDAITKGKQMLELLYPDATVREAQAQVIGEAGIKALGEHGLRQDDYSRQSNELATLRTAAQKADADAKALYEQNRTWFEQRKADLAELDTLRQQVAGRRPAADDDDPSPATGLTKAEFEAAMQTTEQGAVAFMTDLTALAMEHFQRFNEVLDTRALLQDRRVQQLGLRGVYNDVHKARLDALAAKAAADAEQKIRNDERTKVLTEQASQRHTYPVRGNEPSTLDALEAARTGQTPKVAGVDDMVAEYARLSAARTGLPV